MFCTVVTNKTKTSGSSAALYAFPLVFSPPSTPAYQLPTAALLDFKPSVTCFTPPPPPPTPTALRKCGEGRTWGEGGLTGRGDGWVKDIKRGGAKRFEPIRDSRLTFNHYNHLQSKTWGRKMWWRKTREEKGERINWGVGGEGWGKKNCANSDFGKKKKNCWTAISWELKEKKYKWVKFKKVRN